MRVSPRSCDQRVFVCMYVYDCGGWSCVPRTDKPVPWSPWGSDFYPPSRLPGLVPRGHFLLQRLGEGEAHHVVLCAECPAGEARGWVVVIFPELKGTNSYDGPGPLPTFPPSPQRPVAWGREETSCLGLRLWGGLAQPPWGGGVPGGLVMWPEAFRVLVWSPSHPDPDSLVVGPGARLVPPWAADRREGDAWAANTHSSFALCLAKASPQ